MICSQCKKEFIPKNHKYKFCSPECSKNKKILRRRLAVEKYRKKNWEAIKKKNIIGYNKRVKKDPDYPHKLYLIKKKNNPETMKKKAQRNREMTRSNPRRLELRRSTIKLYMRERRKSDPIFKLASNVRTRIGTFLKVRNMRKTNGTFKMVGCTPEFLKKYLEKQFKPGMTWENHSIDGWHIDHKDPLDLAMTLKDVEELCHYTNLQPMWATENLKKGNKII
jgi:hypothetical protein